MGCDIHIHVEIKVDGKWEHYAQPYCQRHYRLFERMAGVRGEVQNAIAAPRGLPPYATKTTRFDCNYWGPDGHSHSWLSSFEVTQIIKEFHDIDEWKNWRYLFGNGYEDFLEYPKSYPEGLEDFRWVFWFDN